MEDTIKKPIADVMLLYLFTIIVVIVIIKALNKTKRKKGLKLSNTGCTTK